MRSISETRLHDFEKQKLEIKGVFIKAFHRLGKRVSMPELIFDIRLHAKGAKKKLREVGRVWAAVALDRLNREELLDIETDDSLGERVLYSLREPNPNPQ